MKVSVVIPCKNEELIVENILKSLAAQTKLPDEIILVDSNSTDRTAVVASQIAKEQGLNLKVISTKTSGVAYARNIGGKEAVGDMLFFMDADVQLPSEYLEKALQEIDKRHLQCGGTRQKMLSEKTGIRVGARMMNVYLKAMQYTPWPIAFSCMFSEKNVFKAVNGFDTELYIMEDYDYALRAKRKKYKFGIIDSTHFLASDRRFDTPEKGLVWRSIYGEIYRYTHGLRVTKKIYDYKMGGKKDA